MTINPVHFNGMLQRTDDVSVVKHHEDAKPVVDQQNIQVSVQQRTDALLHNVTSREDSGQAENHADAREEGKGTYFDSRKQKEKKKELDSSSDGRVVRKMSAGVFDIKI